MPVRLTSIVCSLGLLCAATFSLAAMAAHNANTNLTGLQKEDWPWWRGPHGNGIADADQTPPVEFGPDKNLLWKVAVPGRGHGAPIVVGSRVFLTAADNERQVQSLLCFERETGKLLWQTTVHQGNFVTGGHDKSSLASSTPACDGQRVFVSFINNGGVYASAIDLNGKLVWQEKVSNYVIHQGYGASPVIYENLVIIMADNKGGGAVVGLDRETGKIVWKQDRPKLPNYPSPVIVRLHGKDQLLLTGCDLVTSFDPLTGTKNWEFPGSTTECVTTVVTDGERIFTSGGYPRNHIAAMKADGSGKIDWENNLRVYVPSMIAKDGRLIFVTDAGVAMIRDSATGKEIASLRLGGTFDASPVLVGDHLYALSESGEFYVIKVGPDSLEKLAENKIGDDAFSTPTICGSRIYVRVAEISDGTRQEYLTCFGK